MTRRTKESREREHELLKHTRKLFKATTATHICECMASCNQDNVYYTPSLIYAWWLRPSWTLVHVHKFWHSMNNFQNTEILMPNKSRKNKYLNKICTFAQISLCVLWTLWMNLLRNGIKLIFNFVSINFKIFSPSSNKVIQSQMHTEVCVYFVQYFYWYQ